MAETDQEKTESATPRRLEQAREKGQVPRSRDFNTTVVLLTSAVGTWMFGPTLAEAISNLMTRFFSLSRADAFDTGRMMSALFEALMGLALPLFGLLALVLVITVAGAIAVGGMNFSTQAMAPKFSKMSPLKGLKRMFGLKALVELGKTLAKFAVVALCAWFLLSFNFDRILSLSQVPLPVAMRDALDLMQVLLLLLAAATLLIAVVDVPYQLWNHAKELRMTKQEIKDEYKEVEGRPEVKGRIRQLQREMSQRRMMTEVPQADVVVTNPTHFAVALKYDPAKGGAPTVVAKGVDEIALKIREIAEAHDVPLVAAPPLARALYHTTKLDREIPEGLFVAVAQILAYVHQLRQAKQGRARRPTKLPTDLPIPEEMQY